MYYVCMFTKITLLIHKNSSQKSNSSKNKKILSCIMSIDHIDFHWSMHEMKCSSSIYENSFF